METDTATHDKEMVKLSITLDPATLARVDAWRKREDRSLSSAIRYLVGRQLDLLTASER